jgi:hypothetical protein
MPDHMRVRRNLYERLTEASSPPIPFASMAADDSYNGFLNSSTYLKWMVEELEGGFADRMLPPRFRETLLASLQTGSSSLMNSRSMRTVLKRIIPTSWVIAVRSWGKPDPPQAKVMAFRCALASRLARMLEQDAVFLSESTVPFRDPAR